MFSHRLTRLFEPRSIAVIGALADPSRIGGRLVRVLQSSGYAGPVYAVTRSSEPVAGLETFSDIAMVPSPIDLAVLVVGAAQVPDVLVACSEAGVGAAVVISAGFIDSGSDGTELQRKLEAVVDATGMIILGPNTNGFVNLLDGIPVTFSPTFGRNETARLRRGPVAVVGQSGGLTFALFGEAQSRGLGASFVISTGNEVDVDVLDCVEYSIRRGSGPILLWIEGFVEPSRLGEVADLARRSQRPLVVAKVGGSDAGRRAALSHTAHLAGEQRIYEGLFRHYGIVQAEDQEELIDFALAVSHGALPDGDRVAVVTTSGGAGIWVADALAAEGFSVPVLSDGLQADVREVIPPLGQPSNPIDVTAQILQAQGNLLDVIRLLAACDEIDAVAVVSTLAVEEPFLGTAEELAATVANSAKPVLVYTYTRPTDQNVDLLAAANVPWYPSGRRLARSLSALRKLASRVEGPTAEASSASAAPGMTLDAPPSGALSEHAAKQLLATWGIAVPRGKLVSNAQEAVVAGGELGLPVAVKACATGLVHKTEAGAVKLDCGTPEAVREAVESIAETLYAAPVEGFLIESMVPDGVEMIVGLINYEGLGPMAMVGMGGVYAEVFDDVVLAPCPVTVDEALRMLDDLKASAVLDGVRGRPPADRQALAACISRLSRFGVAHREVLREVDLNPVIVGPRGQGVCAVDAVVVFESGVPLEGD